MFCLVKPSSAGKASGVSPGEEVNPPSPPLNLFPNPSPPSNPPSNPSSPLSLNPSSLPGIFKDVRFYHILNFGLFWATLFSRCFYPIMNFGHFWADPHFLSCEKHFFLAEEEAHNLEFLPHPKFWPFFGRPLKEVLDFFQIFGPASSPHTVSIVSCVFLLSLALALAAFFVSRRTLFAARCARFGMAASTNGHWIL